MATLSGVGLVAPVLAQESADVEAADGAETDEAARAHFRIGQSLYDSGRFREAAEEWEKAYSLSGRGELLYNVYVAYRDATDLGNATDALRRYLNSDAPIDPVKRVNLERRLEAMEARQQQQAEAEEPSAADGAAASVSEHPSDEPEPLRPRHQESSESGSGNSWLPWVVVGIGAGMLVGGTVTGVLTLAEASDLADACPGGDCPPDLHGNVDRANRLATTTNVLLVAGAVVTTGGLVWALLQGSGKSEKASEAGVGVGPLRASLACAPRECHGVLFARY